MGDRCVVSTVLHHSFQSLAQPASSQTPEFMMNDDKNAVKNNSHKLVFGSASCIFYSIKKIFRLLENLRAERAIETINLMHTIVLQKNTLRPQEVKGHTLSTGGTGAGNREDRFADRLYQAHTVTPLWKISGQENFM